MHAKTGTSPVYTITFTKWTVYLTLPKQIRSDGVNQKNRAFTTLGSPIVKIADSPLFLTKSPNLKCCWSYWKIRQR